MFQKVLGAGSVEAAQPQLSMAHQTHCLQIVYEPETSVNKLDVGGRKLERRQIYIYSNLLFLLLSVNSDKHLRISVNPSETTIAILPVQKINRAQGQQKQKRKEKNRTEWEKNHANNTYCSGLNGMKFVP